MRVRVVGGADGLVVQDGIDKTGLSELYFLLHLINNCTVTASTPLNTSGIAAICNFLIDMRVQFLNDVGDQCILFIFQ